MIVVHEIDPTFKRQYLKDGQKTLSNIVKTWDSEHYEIDVTDLIVVDGVKTSLVVDIAAYMKFCIREGLCTVFIFHTKNGGAIIIKLLPKVRITIGVYIKFFSCSAELVLLTEELVSAKDGKDCEDEYQKEEDVGKLRERGQ